jgi:CheY-like chemotaxis protein
MLADILASVRHSLFAEVVDESLLFQITKDAGLSMGEYGKVLAKMGEKIKEAKVFLQIAEHPDLGRAGGNGDIETATVMVIGDDEQRTLWVRGLLESFGYHVLVCNHNEESLFDGKAIQLVILDLHAIPEPKILKFETLLKEKNIAGVALAGNGNGASVNPANQTGYPILPFIFSQEDIGKYLVKEAAYDSQNINSR